MPTYVSLVKWTDQGIKAVKESPKRIEAFEAAVKAAGGSVKGVYLTLGEYDLVVVTEAASDEAATKLILTTAMQGNIRTTTMRAFPRDEAAKILAAL